MSTTGPIGFDNEKYLEEQTASILERVTRFNDKLYLEFADKFEKEFVTQSSDENRTIEETLDLGWKLLSILPEGELKRIDEKYIKQYHPAYREK